MNWKYFWCNHIWKIDKSIPLNDGEIQYNWRLTGGHLNGVKIQRFARYEHCIKCGKTHIKEITKSKVI